MRHSGRESEYMNLGGFQCWVRYPFVKGLCLIAKETEQGGIISATLPSKVNNNKNSAKANIKVQLQYHNHYWPQPLHLKENRLHIIE